MSIALALLVGLLQGSLHCAGMCGPFVLAYALALRPGGNGAPGAPYAGRPDRAGRPEAREAPRPAGGSGAAGQPAAAVAMAAAAVGQLPRGEVAGRPGAGGSAAAERAPGMIGSGAAAPAGSGRPPRRRPLLVAHLAHNGGRLFTFGLLGAAFGGLGSFVDDAARLTGLQAAAAVAGGLAMLLWAVDQARTGHGGSAVERWSPWRGLLQGRLRALFGRRDPWGAFACGALIGLHPCGLIFAMLLSAAATGSALRGAAVLVAFGLGTVPALLGVASAGTWGAGRLRGRTFTYASAGLVAVGGILFTLRGMAVNGWVPHLWPWLF